MTPFDAALDLLWVGGPIMVPLALLSFALWGLFFLECLRMPSFQNGDWKTELARMLLNGSDRPGPFSGRDPRWRAMDWFMARRTGRSGDRALWSAAVHRQVSLTARRGGAVMVLAMTAPLLGLLGTVTGMVDTFEAIGYYGLGNIHALASGVKEALITTQMGLLIAVPGYFAGRYLNRRAGKARREMASFQKMVEPLLSGEADHD